MQRSKHRFFFPATEGKEVHVKWDPGTGLTARYLTICKLRRDGTVGYWKHRALSARFIRFEDSYFMVLRPQFYFSTDGTTPLSPRLTTRLSSGAWARYGNKQLLYDLRFWVGFLSGGKEDLVIETGSSAIEVNTLYEVVGAGFGISSDALENEALLHPIQSSPRNIFRSWPSTQSRLEEFEDDEYLTVDEDDDVSEAALWRESKDGRD